MTEVRIEFHEHLAELERQALSTADIAAEQLDQAIEAVLNSDAELAAMVVENDDAIDGRYLEIHQGILSLLARQAPVATDLRLVAALLHTIVHIERIGDQCVNIAKLVPLMGEGPPNSGDILAKIEAAGAQARDQIKQAQLAFRDRNLKLAEDLVSQDDLIDRLNREIFNAAVDIGGERSRNTRVGRSHDADRPAHRADRGQHGGHRRAGRVRNRRPVPRVHRRVAARLTLQPRVNKIFSGPLPEFHRPRRGAD